MYENLALIIALRFTPLNNANLLNLDYYNRDSVILEYSQIMLDWIWNGYIIKYTFA